LTAKEVWDRDEIKLNLARNSGYEILVIWESEILKNKNEVINKCKNFLTQ